VCSLRPGQFLRCHYEAEGAAGAGFAAGAAGVLLDESLDDDFSAEAGADDDFGAPDFAERESLL